MKLRSRTSGNAAGSLLNIYQRQDSGVSGQLATMRRLWFVLIWPAAAA